MSFDPYPDPEMQAALRSLEYDPLPPAAPVNQAYPVGNIDNRTTIWNEAWRYSA